jgi:transposase-like protein
MRRSYRMHHRSVYPEAAGDLGISVSLLSRWHRKYGKRGKLTRYGGLEGELKELRPESAELKNIAALARA